MVEKKREEPKSPKTDDGRSMLATKKQKYNNKKKQCYARFKKFSSYIGNILIVNLKDFIVILLKYLFVSFG